MRYLVGLLVFSSISSFLISDTIDFSRELRKSNSFRHLFLDFLRLIVLGTMALIGYMFASRTFHQPNDWLVFLVIGIIGALLIHTLARLRVASIKGARRP